MAATGMLRIRYPNSPTMVFEFRHMTRRDCDDQLMLHARIFASGAVRPREPGEHPSMLTAPHARVANDPSVMIAEWVADESTSSETVTPVPLPAALLRAPGR